jgi:hypothetical protein
LPDRGRGPLQPAGQGSAGDRRAVEPALALADQTPPSWWRAGGLGSADTLKVNLLSPGPQTKFLQLVVDMALVLRECWLS